jgi:hypothetical protein
MKPVGLTMKKSRNKYQLSPRGELMLVHACTECESISINRIAADDDPEQVLAVFRSSLDGRQFHEQDISILCAEDAGLVQAQLYGVAA